jgi:hypothetical protein
MMPYYTVSYRPFWKIDGAILYRFLDPAGKEMIPYY